MDTGSVKNSRNGLLPAYGHDMDAVGDILFLNGTDHPGRDIDARLPGRLIFRRAGRFIDQRLRNNYSGHASVHELGIPGW